MPSDFSPEELRAAREARERRSQVSDDMPDFLEEPLPQPEAPRRKGGAVKIASMVVSLLTLAGFAAIVSYAYLWGLGDVSEGQIPIVAAAAEPEKVRPEEPGGMEVPHQDTLVLNDSETEAAVRVERLLPPPEQPRTLEPASQDVAEATPQTDGDLPQASTETAPGQPLALTPGTRGSEPKIPEVPKESEAVADDASVEVAEVEAKTPPAATQKPENQAAAQEETAPRAPATVAKEKEEPETSKAAPRTTQLALKPGDYVIQMAAFRSEERAQSGWRDLQAKHPSVLGDMKLLIQQIDIEGKGTFYRVQTGPFPNKATAEDMCAQLEARGQACIVTRR